MKRVFLTAAVVLVSALGTYAETTETSPIQLPDTIVVTANRFGQPPAKSVWPATVFSPERSGAAPSLHQSLDGRFGLDVRQTSGVGSVTTLSNWGAFNRHILLLYNGRPVRDYSLGGFNLADFSVDEFERIELLKGPQSAFYGADAIGGVVNLISRHSLANRLEFTARAGSFHLQQYRLDVARKLKSNGVGGFAEWGKARNGRPNSGSERMLLGIRGDYLSDDGSHSLMVSGRYFTDSVGTPGPLPDPTSIPVYGSSEASSLTDHQLDINYSGDLSYRYAPGPGSLVQLDLFWEKKNLDYHSLYNYQYPYYVPIGDDSAASSDSVDVTARTIYNKRSAGASARLQKQSGNVTLSAGLDWLSGSLRATNFEELHGTNTDGPWAPYSYEFDAYTFWSRSQDQFDAWSSVQTALSGEWMFDISSRLQFVRGRQPQPSYNLGTVLSARPDLRFKLGYGFAFRFPSIADQFADETFVHGRAELNPETSRTLVASFETEPGIASATVRLSVFAQRVDSLIQYQWDQSILRSVPHNVHSFRSRGLDLAVSACILRTHRLVLGAVIQDAEQTDSEGRFIQAHYVPEVKWRADLSGQMKSVGTYNLNVIYNSTRHIVLFDGAGKSIASVYELGASISVPVTPAVTFNLAGFDLTDQRRPDQFGFQPGDGDYPSPGRSFILEARLKAW